MTPQPKPKIVKQVCSLCGLDWKDHGKEPTTETCISLLLGEVRSLNARLAHRPYPYAQPLPYVPTPWIQPLPWTQPRPPYESSGRRASATARRSRPVPRSARTQSPSPNPQPWVESPSDARVTLHSNETPKAPRQSAAPDPPEGNRGR